MQRMIGNGVTVFLKGSDNSVLGDISGIVVDVSEDSLYVQDSSDKVFVIPRGNIRYCTTDRVSEQSQVINNEHREPQYQQCEKEEAPVIDCLNVYVNQQQVANIPIPPTFKVDVWNENILRVLMGNPDVQNALAGKVQKGLEYFPGRVYISVDEITPPSQMPDQTAGYMDSSNSFSMGGSPMQQYLSPTQMVSRLNKVVKQGNNNGKTKV